MLEKAINLKHKVETLTKDKYDIIDSYDKKALQLIMQNLDDIIAELRLQKLKAKEKRYPIIARILIDRDTSLIDEKLGSALIDLEQEYLAY